MILYLFLLRDDDVLVNNFLLSLKYIFFGDMVLVNGFVVMFISQYWHLSTFGIIHMHETIFFPAVIGLFHSFW